MKTSITVWTVSALSNEGDISQLYCHQDLAKAHAFIWDEWQRHPDWNSMFITQETLSEEEYIGRLPTNWRNNYIGAA